MFRPYNLTNPSGTGAPVPVVFEPAAQRRWQYHVEWVDLRESQPLGEEQLAALGQDGWLLAEIVPPGEASRGRMVYYFVREEGLAMADYGALGAISNIVVPTVIESGLRGERAYDIFSRLLKERIVLINGPIEDQIASLVVAEILFLSSEDPNKEINLHINSGGGVVTAGLAIYDTMRSVKCPLATTCVGLAASFGTILLMAGDPGKRFALPHARVHMHQPLITGGGISGQATDIDIHARELLHTRQVLTEIIALHTGQPLDRVKRDTERDFFLSAEEAVEYGIVDEVLALQDWQARRVRKAG